MTSSDFIAKLKSVLLMLNCWICEGSKSVVKNLTSVKSTVLSSFLSEYNTSNTARVWRGLQLPFKSSRKLKEILSSTGNLRSSSDVAPVRRKPKFRTMLGVHLFGCFVFVKSMWAQARLTAALCCPQNCHWEGKSKKSPLSHLQLRMWCKKVGAACGGMRLRKWLGKDARRDLPDFIVHSKRCGAHCVSFGYHRESASPSSSSTRGERRSSGCPSTSALLSSASWNKTVWQVISLAKWYRQSLPRRQVSENLKRAWDE